MSKSPTTTDDEWLHNPHAGEILASEFMEPLALSAEALAASLEVPSAAVSNLIVGKSVIDGELDLRLGRYFGMSEGFFLRLQNAYDLTEARRAHGVAIAAPPNFNGQASSPRTRGPISSGG